MNFPKFRSAVKFAHKCIAFDQACAIATLNDLRKHCEEDEDENEEEEEEEHDAVKDDDGDEDVDEDADEEMNTPRAGSFTLTPQRAGKSVTQLLQTVCASP